MTYALPTTRCGFVALIGAPNAGKSTLLNALVGSKISIVTPKAQTTRSRITGICMHQQSQLVLVDVPGIFAAQKRFEKAMVDCAWSSASEADAVLFLYDVKRKPDAETEAALERLKSIHKPLYLALNKVDVLADKAKLLALVAWFQARATFADVFMISALKRDGLTVLLDKVSAALPQSPFLFPEDTMTEIPMRFLAAELTREQCFLRLSEEIPYTLAVETESYDERADGSIEIRQIIVVQNERQKIIVIGNGGAQLKAIGMAARQEIARVFGHPCHLFLFVKVREDWKEQPAMYAMLGLKHG
ncbi:MAG: GTPase Era [Rickettsiales bacterium]|nr:GTPase Era [Rickettsiales bacterium]